MALRYDWQSRWALIDRVGIEDPLLQAMYTTMLVYALHCPELAAPFLAIWYLLGMLIPTAIGAWLGPRPLRW
jgi:hypothetical protein